MTFKDLIAFCETKKEHYTITKKFIMDGYRQESGGYIDCAICQEKSIDPNAGEPNQRWHFINYASFQHNAVTLNKKSDKFCYGRIQCPEMLLWFAEAVLGDNAEIVRKAAENAKNIIDSVEARARTDAGYKIRKDIPWETLEKEIVKQNKDSY